MRKNPELSSFFCMNLTRDFLLSLIKRGYIGKCTTIK